MKRIIVNHGGHDEVDSSSVASIGVLAMEKALHDMTIPRRIKLHCM